MRADEERFYESALKMDHESLLSAYVSLHTEHEELLRTKRETDRITTEGVIQFQKLTKDYQDSLIKIEQLEKTIKKLSDQLELKNRAIFGRNTEKFLDTLASSENPPEEFEDESQTEDCDEGNNDSHTIISLDEYRKSLEEGSKGNPEGRKEGKNAGNKKGKGLKRSRLLDSLKGLPSQLIYDLDIDKLNSDYGVGNWRIAMWHEHYVVEKIENPLYVKKILTPVISSGLEHVMTTIPYKNPLKDRTYISASILADILYRKFFLALPFFRQAEDYSMQGLELSRQVIIGWVNELVPLIMTPVIKYMTQLMLLCPYHNCDETYLQVLRDGRAPGTKGFLWVHSTGELYDGNPIIIFIYEQTRGTDHLRKLLLEFHGYLTCDAYISYHVMEKESEGRITVTGCMMHCRRYFALSLFVKDLKNMSEEEIIHLPEVKVLMLIRAIYHEEMKLKNLAADDRLAARKEFVAPNVKAMFDYIHELEASDEPRSEKLSKAISYAINQEEYLCRFLEDGNIPIDNGSSERYIASYSRGRANWLFADTILGAEVNAAMYSIVETAKVNQVNPYEYIKYLLEKMPELLDDEGNVTDPECLKDMMPWSEAFHEYEHECMCRRNSLYSSMFPEPMVPKPPKKATSLAPDDPGQNTA
nr:IS66 family transposase [uncultured Butyrivibrio sp.]